MARTTVDDLLAAARARIAPRPGPEETLAALAEGALVVDLRSSDERRRDGVIPGSLHVPRSVLEWRADPESPWRNPMLGDVQRRVILVCAHGFSSSLAAASLRELGFEHATYLDGGFEAWRASGLPLRPAPKPSADLAGMGRPDV